MDPESGRMARSRREILLDYGTDPFTVLQRAQIMAGWIFHPTMGDIDAVPLPSALYPLYAVVRPLRLLRHPWWRDWRTFVARG